MSIATIILDQLGGPGFIMMTGAKNFVSDGNTLRMTPVSYTHLDVYKRQGYQHHR